MAKRDPDTEIRRERFRAYCRERGWAREGGGWQAKLIAERIKKPVQKASDLLNGNGSFGSTIAREIEEALGLPKNYLDDDGSGTGEFEDIGRVDVRVAAGQGAIPALVEEIGTLKFRRDFLRSVGVTKENAVLVAVKGVSMEPSIRDGSTLLVNKANRQPQRDQVYVFWRRDEGLVVKRVVKAPDGRWLARSDNDDRQQFPDFSFEDDDYLIGRAVWMGAKL